ncbi:DUF3203 family protein [Pseudomonas sp. UL073]|uniref:DUF3203 family protein n=1 Tax=Zestomonas insulae TaxID=2809017 RepID=A0ABS2IJS8_9GAMM|nr:DUF3203 family protein [Pseudomonas insulae]MBM7062103.1 DUF3203 family protein [Pseudomonas insulae]
MAISIDVDKGSCTFDLEGARHERTIADLVIRTDHHARMSQVEVAGQQVHISEDDAQCLIGAGALDDRSHVKTGEI